MSVRKQRFPCGHVGFGRYCHRCEHAAYLMNVIKLPKKKRKTVKGRIGRMEDDELRAEAKRLKDTGKEVHFRISTHPKMLAEETSK